MDGDVTRETPFAEGRILLRRAGGVARIVFNAPEKMNAMRLAMWEALAEICDELATDPDLRVLVLEGAGDRAFVAGADISEFGETRSDATGAARYNAAVARAERAVEVMPVPVLALIRGYCIGGGLGIAMRCDLRLAAADARFAITPAKLGLGYGYEGVASLLSRLGHARTADLLFTGRRLNAEEARAAGIADFLYPVDQFEAECAAYIDRLAANAPLTIRAVKAALLELARPEGARDPERVEALVRACFDSADYQEGQRAFAEKRKPRFEGR
ncbi:enoyl-CoA hydratase [Roseivivax sp. GX 12232]|uniref:enoyl-CoA hydratase n=1 Tax=Roseivivax sp. GX 12232 TaxID=2900547 RepID=UPI001E326E4E|nr:enoyl-CoA hydratase [Roseivivax sp. GX 12232]MCE0506148.1 enoyl-CoA hydratase [Roseivivax sp. GX 12232]